MFAPKSPKKAKPIKTPPPISQAAIQARAYELWRSRSTYSTAEEDWNEAKRQLEQEQAARLKEMRKVASRLNQLFLYLEKRVWEPGANLVERAAFFQIVEKLSPVFEAIGVLLIPFVVWWATQSYQMQKDEQDQAIRQQEAIKNYLNQLTTVFLDGKIKQDSDLQSVTRASTLALLRDPSLNGDGKGQVIGFLSELDLIAIDTENEEGIKKGETQKKQKKPVISLEGVDLSRANLIIANLSYANLSRADLRFAFLRYANLSYADLRFAFLLNANLSYANLLGADLRNVYLGGANLSGANFRDANLRDADLSKAKNWTEEQLDRAKLCKTQLPSGTSLDPNRDCKELGIPVSTREDLQAKPVCHSMKQRDPIG
jgi:hypothetical protein